MHKSLLRTAASAAERASAVLPWGEKEGREAAAAAGLLSSDGSWCRCRPAPSLLGAWDGLAALSGDTLPRPSSVRFISQA